MAANNAVAINLEKPDHESFPVKRTPVSRNAVMRTSSFSCRGCSSYGEHNLMCRLSQALWWRQSIDKTSKLEPVDAEVPETDEKGGELRKFFFSALERTSTAVFFST
jgi:hypothetical protein